MFISDNTVREKLKNVYFLIGDSCAGKTTAAKRLCKKYGMAHYSSDEMRGRHFAAAEAQYQPCMKRPDADRLSVEQAWQWERDIVREFTPMMIADLMQLSGMHRHIVCEGDIDMEILFRTIDRRHIFCLLVVPELFQREFFQRPDHIHMIDNIQRRADLSQGEKDEKIAELKILAGVEDAASKDGAVVVPLAVVQSGIPYYIRNERSTMEDMMAKIEAHFGLTA